MTKEVTELSITIHEEPIEGFLAESEEHGSVELPALEAFALEHELDEEELSGLRAELEARDVEIVTPEPEAEAEPEAAWATADASGALDSLTLFMNRAGRYPLLTAA